MTVLLYLKMILCLPPHQLRMLLQVKLFQLLQLMLLKEVRLWYALLRETPRFYKQNFKNILKIITFVCILILPKPDSRLKSYISKTSRQTIQSKGRMTSKDTGITNSPKRYVPNYYSKLKFSSIFCHYLTLIMDGSHFLWLLWFPEKS